MTETIRSSILRAGRRLIASSAGGALFGLTAGLVWGGQFAVAKTVLPTLGPFYLTTARYLVAAVGFLLLLRLIEGGSALRPEGRLVTLTLLGTIGFAGFNLLVFEGLAHSRPQNAALLIATMPLLTTLVLWARRGIRPPLATAVLLLAALFGAGLVISRGHLSYITSGQVGYGDLLVILGALCWVIYSMGAASFPGWSALRYTALTATSGSVAILLITLVATAFGLIAAPSLTATAEAWRQIAYMSIPAGIVAVLAWNAAIRRLGPQNGVLFINLVPITTFTIEAVSGNAITPIEVAGAALTLGALILNNMVSRRTIVAAPGPSRGEALPPGVLRATGAFPR